MSFGSLLSRNFCFYCDTSTSKRIGMGRLMSGVPRILMSINDRFGSNLHSLTLSLLNHPNDTS